MTMNRRTFVRHMCLGGIATFGFPVVNFAQTRRGGRFVFVLLRGGFDGLAAVVPYGDPSYRSLRAGFSYDESELMELTDTFGLAPGLAPLREVWQKNELVALHAMAIPYRTRSHFDGQAILETGIDKPVGSSDGWLNRLLQVMSGQRSGIAIACRRCIAPTRFSTAASRRRYNSRILSARNRWRAGARAAAVSRRSCRRRRRFCGRMADPTSQLSSSAGGIRMRIKGSRAAH